MAESSNEMVVFRGINALYTLEAAAKKNGRYIAPGDVDCIREAAMVVRGGRVAWTGPEKNLLKDIPEAARARDEHLGGTSVIPALVESHTHLVYAGIRAGEFERRNQGESYQSIAESGGGILATVLPTRASTLESLVQSGQKRAEKFLRQGVSTIEVKSGYALDVEGELKMLKAARSIERARIVPTFLGAHAIPKEFSSAGSYLDHLATEALPRVMNEGLAKRIDIFVEKGYFPADLAKPYLSKAKAMGFEIAVHAEQLSHSGGARLAVELGARSAEHLIQIDDEDVNRLAASETTSVLLPSADLYMNCAYPPARALLDKGARVALATDFNPGSSPSQDVALVGVLARIMMKMTFAEVLVAYTLGGAHALGFGDELGSLTTGKLCDFCVLEGGVEELFLEVGRMPIARLYREGERLF